MQQQLLTRDTIDRIGGIDPYAGVRRVLSETDAQSLLDRLLYADIKTYLHELLMKQDQMSMAASVESRVPFLDHKLVEFTSSLPERLKLRRWTTKYVLRQSMKGVLPRADSRAAEDGIPGADWRVVPRRVRPVLDEYVLGSRAIERGIFNADVCARACEQHQRGVANHSERLWSLVNLEMWFRRFIDGENRGAEVWKALTKVCWQQRELRTNMGIIGGTVGYNLLRRISVDGETGYCDGSAYQGVSKTRKAARQKDLARNAKTKS